jgi:hypothetical protein
VYDKLGKVGSDQEQAELYNQRVEELGMRSLQEKFSSFRISFFFTSPPIIVLPFSDCLSS